MTVRDDDRDREMLGALGRDAMSMWPMDGGTIIAFSNDDVARVPEVCVEICLGFVSHKISCLPQLLLACFSSLELSLLLS